MPKRNVVLLVVTCLVSLVAWAARERSGHARRFGEVMTAIERNYVRPVDGERLYEAAVEAAVGGLDEHSAYLRDTGRDELESALDQEFGGVGLELALDAASGQPVVISPVMHSPAWRAGVAAGDLIAAVDGHSTAGQLLHDTVDRLRGQVGGAVTLTILSPPPQGTLDPAVPQPAGTTREVTLLREVIEVESVQGDRRRADGSWDWMLEGEPGVAYLRILSFGERTAAELAAALEAVASHDDLRGLVLDLRGNPGGLLQAAVDVCDAFLDEGVIVATRGRHDAAAAPSLDERRAAAGQWLAGVPVAVLVDGLTASAGEIVAACLQDTGRATVVGSRTFGKGTVQSLMPLSDGHGLLKLTTAEYLRPSRETIDRGRGAGDDETWGVRPDAGYEVEPTAEAVERVRDWRRGRGVVPVSGVTAAAMASSSRPREIDAVLARAVEALGVSQ